MRQQLVIFFLRLALWTPENAGVRLPLLIFFLCLALGTPKNAGVT